MHTHRLMIFPATLVASLSFLGCSNSRDVEVSGEVTASSGAQLQGPIVLEFYELAQDGDSPERMLAATSRMQSAGAFREKISVEGERILVRAIGDNDANGSCTEGEPWAELEAEIAEDDTVTEVSLQLTVRECPTQPASKDES